jgi:outer membrane protein assembly factor BamE
MRILILISAALALSACKQNVELPSLISPYRIDIQQGNVITQEMVSKLKAGMTRSQVRFVLGSPLITDMFHNDRWDYVYLMQKQGRADERRRLTVIFDGDKLVTLEGDVVMTDQLPDSAPALRQPAAVVSPDGKPAAKPAPKAEAAKPALKPPVVTNPPQQPALVAPAAASKPEGLTAPASTPAPQKEAAKPAVATPVAKPLPAEVEAPAPDPEKSDAAKADVPAADPLKPDQGKPAPAPADVSKADAMIEGPANADSTKASAAKTDPAKPEAPAADPKKDPANRGLFGRMLDKIGF